MRRNKLVSALSLLTVCSVGALFFGGCADNNTTLFISGVQGFEPGGECDIESSLSSVQLGHGSYDPTAGAPYRAPLILANGLQPLGDNDTLKPETSRILIEGAEIEIQTPSGAAAIDIFTTNFSAAIHPDDSEDPGVTTVPVPIIPAGVGLSPGEYVVQIQAFGETLGGTKVESNLFKFPVTVVNPGELLFCGDLSAVDGGADAVHPCGALAQDGYLFPCFAIPTAGCVSFCG